MTGFASSMMIVVGFATIFLLGTSTVAAEGRDSLHVWGEDPEGDLRNEYPPAQDDDHRYVDMLRILSEYNATRDTIAFVIEVADATGVTERGSDWDFTCTAEFLVILEDEVVRRMTVGVESSKTAPETVAGVAYSHPPSQPTQKRQLDNESQTTLEEPGFYSVTLERQRLMNEGDSLAYRNAVCNSVIQPLGLFGYVVGDSNANASANRLVFSDLSPRSGSNDDPDDLERTREAADGETDDQKAPNLAFVGALIGITLMLRRQYVSNR